MKSHAAPAALASLALAAMLLAPLPGAAAGSGKASGKASAKKSENPAVVAAPLPPVPTQQSVAMDFIYHLLMGNRDSVAMLFDEELKPKVTQEVVDGLQGQFKWLYNFIRGDFEEFGSGWLDSTAYFREFRMSNETNKRAPLILIQVLYPDSVKPLLTGAQVKSFVGGNEKLIAGEQTWKVEGRSYDLHSIITAKISSGNLLAVRFYDTDTAELTQSSVAYHGIPIAKEAVARGYMDSARKALEGAELLPDVGVVFIRNDKRQGYMQANVSFRPSDLGLADPDSVTNSAPGAKKSSAKKAEKKSEGQAEGKTEKSPTKKPAK